MSQHAPRHRAWTLALATALVLGGCASRGHIEIPGDSADYGRAIVDARNEQMLTNLIRLRYGEPAYFMDVSSVTTRYLWQVSGGLTGAASVDSSAMTTQGFSGGLTGSVLVEERPTVIYEPLKGKDFAARLLTPIPLEILTSELQMGWRFDRLMLCCVQRINGVWNAPTASGPTPDLAPRSRSAKDFREVITLFEALRRAEALEIRVDERDWAPTKEGPPNEDRAHHRCTSRIRFIRSPRGGEDPFQERAVAGSIAAIKDVLGLSEDLDDFCVVTMPSGDPLDQGQQIVVTPRSLMGIMYYLSQAVRPADADVDEGRARVTRRRSSPCVAEAQDGNVPTPGCRFDWVSNNGHTFEVHSSPSRPDDAFVLVKYRKTWFYLLDDDIDSKATFSLLDQLFQLQAGVVEGTIPALTVPLD